LYTIPFVIAGRRLQAPQRRGFRFVLALNTAFLRAVAVIPAL
jgi:hypothetical protein